MASYDLYGFLLNDLHDAKRILEVAFDVRFEARDSDYMGGEYFRWGRTGSENLVLKVNLDPYDDEPAEILFPNYPVLLYINKTLRSEVLREHVVRSGADVYLLRHEDLD